MFEQLLAVDQHERVHSTGGDKVGGEHGFAEGRGGGQHAGVVGEHRGGGAFLLRTEGSGEKKIERSSRDTLVADHSFDFQLFE